MSEEKKEIRLFGAGFANCLLAYRLLEKPNIDLKIYENESLLHRSQTWSCYSTDFENKNWLEKLPFHSWPKYEVRFPSYKRTLNVGYHSLRSNELRNELLPSLSPFIQEKGTEPEPPFIDGRGFKKDLGPCGFQKFLGLTLRIENHGLSHPIIMDATVEQLDGFRFIYVLPWDAQTLLIEDTRYSDTPVIDNASYQKEILSYAKKNFGKVAQILEEEEGSLPIPLTNQGFPTEFTSHSGVRGGYFHPITGYSFPLVMRYAEEFQKDLLIETPQNLQKFWNDWTSQLPFYLMLNQMMFGASAPDQRIKIFERFYRLSEGLIHRFYSGRSTSLDKIRILTGRPPVSIFRAINCLTSKAWMKRFAC